MKKNQNKKVLLVVLLFFSIITLSSFRDVSCWFGWCNSGDPVVQPTPENYTESGGSVSNGRCVFYQPQTFKLFGIGIANRTQESTGDCVQ